MPATKYAKGGGRPGQSTAAPPYKSSGQSGYKKVATGTARPRQPTTTQPSQGPARGGYPAISTTTARLDNRYPGQPPLPNRPSRPLSGMGQKTFMNSGRLTAPQPKAQQVPLHYQQKPVSTTANKPSIGTGQKQASYYGQVKRPQQPPMHNQRAPVLVPTRKPSLKTTQNPPPYQGGLKQPRQGFPGNGEHALLPAQRNPPRMSSNSYQPLPTAPKHVPQTYRPPGRPTRENESVVIGCSAQGS
ncbi:hypothetical protein LTR85_002771 [Meristemomyces frigidus]|nr:hypothetical protein LTR85_002771 [Meristemomyces frigidus]